MTTRIRPRPAHAPGPTYVAYSKNGRKLVTVGNNSVIRVFTNGSDAEPAIIDVPQEAHTALSVADNFFVTGSEDGHVCKYSLETTSLDEILLRTTLPVRHVAISPDGNWVAVASDELIVKLVNVRDMTQVLQLKEQPKAVKHVAFDHSGSRLAVTCSDGVVYVYSISSEEPKLVKKLDGLVKMLETDAQATSAVIWHPDGRALAAPTATRAVQVVSTKDWQNQKSFQSGHAGDITAAAWSHNGALLATAGADRTLTLWDATTQEIVKKFNDIREPVLSISWHPVENIVSYTNNDGELYIHTDFVPAAQVSLLEKALVPAPMRGEALSEISSNLQRPQTDGAKTNGRRREGTPDSLDDLLDIGGQSDAGGDDFIEDDDGAGYAEVVKDQGKRSADYLSGPQPKRHASNAVWKPTVHPSFQPSSTPWRGNRRYLCLNLTGFIWTVDQDAHHTITVEFYDRALHRDFHFTDPFLYDRACLSAQGAAFSCPSSSRHGSLIYYRPHETWTARTDWRTSLPAGEEVTSLALSTSYITVTTTAGYIRVYTLFGVPFRVYRSSSLPIVTSASWRDYLLIVTNGSVTSDGSTSLTYSIDNVKRDETHQSAAPLPLPPSAELSSIFWSEKGDPCAYDSTGVLLVCLHWRVMGQGKWVPLLDTTALERLAGGKKDEAYWPVAVAGDKFHCIILKGGEQYPYFPRPLLSEFEFEVPLGKRLKGQDEMETDDNDEDERRRLEEKFVRESVLLELKEEYVQNTRVGREEKTGLARSEVEVDKVLLQLLAQECREGEERGMRALEIVGLMRDRTGKMLEAAGKIAGRFGREVLVEKIMQLGERRLVGLREEDEE